MVRRILLICGIVSSVLYIALDILGTLRYPGYRYTEQQFSELTAASTPVRPLMIALSVIPYTLLVATFAVGVFTSAPKKRPGRITGAMLPTIMNRVYGASAVQGVPVAASRHCLRITA
jgi:hypothetical membrane protein